MRESQRLESGNRLLDLVRRAQGVDDDQKSWVVNAALSSGVSAIYTGMADILRGLLSVVDGYVPGGDRAHRDILDQASIAIDGVRPLIISSEVYDGLIELNGFRHFERHNYRFRFDGFLVEESE